MKLGTLIGRALMALFALGSIASAAFVVRAAYQRGLGPTLEPVSPTSTSEPLFVQAEIPTLTAVPSTIVITPTVPPSTATVTPQPAVCGETTAWNLLMLGVDTVAMRGDKGADLVRVVRLDFPNRKATVYAFPRDLWVNIGSLGLTNPTVDATELGTTFYEAMHRSTRTIKRDAMIDGTNAVAKALTWNFSVQNAHYMTIDVSDVPAMVDAVGGVSINIPERTTDPWIGMVFEPGLQTLNGTQVVAYARAKPDSDLGRINRQKLIVDALRQKLLDPSVWTKVPQLFSQFNQAFVTDLSPEQINHLSCLMNEAPKESIIQDGVNPAWTSPGPAAGSLSWNSTSVMNQLRTLGIVQ